MDKTEKKNKHFFVKIFFVVIIVCGTILYSAYFPTTMKLLDGNINKLLKSVGMETKISVFENFSEFSERIINKTEFFVEIIKGNLDQKEEKNKPVPTVLITCNAKFPLESRKISSFFGKREDPFSHKEDIHEGIDIAAAFGSKVASAWPGTVCKTGFDDIYGNFVVIKHSKDFFTRYCHLSEISVAEESFVNAGEKVGETGSTGRSTGSHLHFEVIVEGTKIDPMLCFEL
ncbi:MAG: M23 family metallopeptidase [Oscillospiraceae bacterium]|nr:M23 family metallopeptidase [Oscillospiraceae bacterium]